MIIKYSIVGSRSKIAKEIIKNMPSDFHLIKESKIEKCNDLKLLILSTDSNKAIRYISEYSHLKIIDLSSSQKLSSFINESNQNIEKFKFNYGLDILKTDFSSNNVAIPGCSPTGSLYSLIPLKDFLEEDIFINVNFSKSAMRRMSPNQDKIKNNIFLVKPLEHYHQQEISYVLNHRFKINLAANVIDVPHGISINIFAKIKPDQNAFDILEQYYRDNNRIIVSNDKVATLSEALFNDKVMIFVKQKGSQLLINVVLDNLISGGSYLAVEAAKKIFSLK